ncbi:reverse transcriptase [Corchorus capsularis]|uniref:Reverse transcriptase n=1 Tax=Corchorus capsularis TaxID=210143 RepID=A0A1R3JZR2_COCAP|nr:reverse transcriptase [Corchorus capsularis]
MSSSGYGADVPTYLQDMLSKIMAAFDDKTKAIDERANERMIAMEERFVQLAKGVHGDNGKTLEVPAASETNNGAIDTTIPTLNNTTGAKDGIASASADTTYVTKDQLQSLDDDLKLKEFSKSLTGKAYTWYVNLIPGSIESWNQMCTQFGEKFFPTQEKLTLIDLGREHQKSGEDLMEYIQRFRERVLDVHDAYNERELVKVCMQGMFDEYRVHLENLPLYTFAALVEAARRTNSSVQRQKESRYARRNTPPVHAVQFQKRNNDRPRNDRFQKRPKTDFRRGDDAPPFPVPVEKVRALLQEWIRDGQINLPFVSRMPTGQEKIDPKYCDYHRVVGHPFAECWSMRRLIQNRVRKGELVINSNDTVQVNLLPTHGACAVIHSLRDEQYENEDAYDTHVAAVMTSTIASSLLKTPNVRHFFDMLGFCDDARKEAAEALVQVANKYHDMCTPDPNHNKPLYVESTINGVYIRTTFIDDGSGLNLMPLKTLRALGIDQRSLRHPMIINAFDNKGTRTLGYVTVNMKVGNIQEQTCFHVLDADVAYHVLVGRKWLHAHYLIASTLHQCIKGYWNDKEVSIPATKAPFEQNEVRYAEASFFDELADDGEGALGRPIGVSLPPWSNYDGISHCNVKRTKKGNKMRCGNATGGSRGADVTSYTRADGRIDKPKPQEEELEELNIADEGGTPKPLFLSKNLSAEQKSVLIELLKEFEDVFAWSYEQMPGLDTNLVTHELHIAPGSRLVKQSARLFQPEIETKIKEEIEKLLRVDSSSLFTILHGHEMFSFMDGFSGYNQIKMAQEDAEKTAFRTPIGNFYYTVVPFGLKNAGATYQRAMTAIFHDMLHECVEDYVDDIVVKSKKAADHLTDLRKVFERCRKYNLRMNPLKCAFGVTSGKFLGGSGAGIVLVPPEARCEHEEALSLAFKLDFPCTNNQAEYEALVLGLHTARIIGVEELCIIGDSNLVVKQTNGEFSLKEPTLAPYRDLVRSFLDKFQSVRCEHSPRSSNRYADALATLASKINMPDGEQTIPLTVKRWSIPSPHALWMETPKGEEEQDWRDPIIQQLGDPTSNLLPSLKKYVLIHGTLYYRGANEVLARCVSSKEADCRLKAAHRQWCGQEGPPLYRRLQRAGYYWPTMMKDATHMESLCAKCSEPPNVHECHFVGSVGDCRRPYIDFLQNGVLLTNYQDARRIKRRAERFFLKGNELFRTSFAGKPLKCVSPADMTALLEDVHGGVKMAFDTAIVRFHYEGRFSGVDEELQYVGGYVDDLVFDPDKISKNEFEQLCQRAGYKNIVRMFYQRPGFLLCDGLKPIINDASIIDMTGELFLNDGVIDVYVEHGVEVVPEIAGLLENGENLADPPVVNLGDPPVVNLGDPVEDVGVNLQDVHVEDNGDINDDVGEVEVDEVNLEGLHDEDGEDEGPAAGENGENDLESDGEGISEFHIDSEYDDSDDPLEIESDEELIVNEATTMRGRFPRFDSTADVPYIYKSMLFKNSDEFKLASKEMIVESYVVNYEEEFAKLWSYKDMILLSNPGSTVKMDTFRADPDGPPVFERMYICLGALKEGRDGNNQMFPVAWALVEDETTLTWSWFIECLQEDLGIGDRFGFTFMSDQHKAIQRSIEDNVPQAEHRFCARHVWVNWQGRGHRGDEMNDFFWRLVKAPTLREYYEILDKLKQKSSQAATDFEAYTPPAKFCRTFFRLESMVEVADNNLCEAFNKTLLKARKMPVISLFEMMRREMMKRIVKKNNELSRWRDGLGPRIWQSIEKSAKIAQYCRVIFNGADGYEVEHGESRYVVRLEEKTCTCRIYKLSGVPCAHAICAIRERRGNVAEFVSSWYSKEVYMQSYSNPIQSMPGLKDWPTSDLPPNSTTPSHEEVNCSSPPQNPAKTKKKAHSSSQASVSVQIPDLNANANSQAASSGCGDAEASASVILPSQQSGTDPTTVNSSSKAKSGQSKKKKQTLMLDLGRKRDSTVTDNNGRVLECVWVKGQVRLSQAKYANQRRITATFLQRAAQKKFRARLEALKKGLQPAASGDNVPLQGTQESVTTASASSKGKNKQQN